jgi:hypothetical protein
MVDGTRVVQGFEVGPFAVRHGMDAAYGDGGRIS